MPLVCKIAVFCTSTCYSSAPPREVVPWETWTTTLDVAIALADDAGLQLAVDEGDVVRDLVLESTDLRVLEYAGNRYELFDPVLDFVGHDAPALRVLVVYFFPAVTLERPPIVNGPVDERRRVVECSRGNSFMVNWLVEPSS